MLCEGFRCFTHVCLETIYSIAYLYLLALIIKKECFPEIMF